MKTKFILAGLAGGIFNFFLGWLVYGVLMMGFFEANSTHYEGLMKEMPVMSYLILSCLLSAFLLAFIFDHWAHIASLKGGLAGGLIIGLFISAMYDLSFLSMWNLYNAKAAIVDMLLGGLVYSATGGIVGLVLSSGKRTE
jgi:hypothetical protein